MDLMTVPEAARRLRLGRSTVYMMAQRGEIPTVRIGTAVRIPVPELDRWLAGQVRGVADLRDTA